LKNAIIEFSGGKDSVLGLINSRKNGFSINVGIFFLFDNNEDQLDLVKKLSIEYSLNLLIYKYDLTVINSKDLYFDFLISLKKIYNVDFLISCENKNNSIMQYKYELHKYTGLKIYIPYLFTYYSDFITDFNDLNIKLLDVDNDFSLIDNKTFVYHFYNKNLDFISNKQTIVKPS
jgi:hypothetical protein